MKSVFFLSLVLMVTRVNAEEFFPASCNPLVVPKESVLLKTKEPLLVLVHNVSSGDLWITHPVTEPNASAGWSSHLETGNWSALVVDKAAFELSCIESKPGHEQQVPCAGVIAVCEWHKIKIPSRGTFWAGENMTLAALTSHLGNQGYVLPGA